MLARFLRLLAIVFIVLPPLCAPAQTAAAPLELHHPIQDKNFFLLSLIERDAKVQDALASDPGIAAIASERNGALITAETACKSDAICLVKAYLWTVPRQNSIRARSR